jgi:hypothetical protein
MARLAAKNRRSRSRPAAPASAAAASEKRPEVIIDFHVERGLLFVALKNIGAASAYDVVTRFDRPFHGLGGRKDMTGMALFRRIAFLPPGKAFLQLVDPLDAFFRRSEPLQLTAMVTYRSRDGARFEEEMPHDLQIYRDLGDIERSL